MRHSAGGKALALSYKMAPIIFSLKDTEIIRLYPWRQSRSTWVGRSAPSVCLFVCVFAIAAQLKIEWSQPKVFKLGTWPWDILRNDLVLGWTVKGQGHRVNKCTFHTNGYYAYVNAHLAWVQTLWVSSVLNFSGIAYVNLKSSRPYCDWKCTLTIFWVLSSGIFFFFYCITLVPLLYLCTVCVSNLCSFPCMCLYIVYIHICLPPCLGLFLSDIICRIKVVIILPTGITKMHRG